jgi:hypothetical protein
VNTFGRVRPVNEGIGVTMFNDTEYVLRHEQAVALAARLQEVTGTSPVAKIVAWLRSKEDALGMLVAKHDDDPKEWRTVKDIVDAIERGEHEGE